MSKTFAQLGNTNHPVAIWNQSKTSIVFWPVDILRQSNIWCIQCQNQDEIFITLYWEIHMRHINGEAKHSLGLFQTLQYWCLDILNSVKRTIWYSRLNQHTKHLDLKLNDDDVDIVDIKCIFVAGVCIRHIFIKASHQFRAQLYFLV